MLLSPPGLHRLPQAEEDEIFVPQPEMVSSPLSATSATSSSTGYSHAPFGLGYGFLSPVSRGGSLSGETEMRMALAFLEDSADEGGYRFQDTVKKGGGTLKKLGKGFKEFVRRRT